MDKLNFLMGLHCHQPVDNFENIFEAAYTKSYEPFLSVLERHPGVKISFHYSGSLLDWLVKKKPDFIKRARTLVESGQVEILGGGHFEPILPMIPAEDAKGQIRMLAASIEKHFGTLPRGIWLAERMWDPAITDILEDLNIKYTILDDFHLKQAGKKDDEVFGHYSVFGTRGLSVFPSIKKLRYTMPFRKPEVTMDFLEGLRGKPHVGSVTFADDCEKFGFWPHTYDWVYRKEWLEKFFTKLEESDSIRTLTFSEALDQSEPLGKAEIPHSSYAEMSEWCSGNFENFFKKYPESNLMRKRMLQTSKEYRKNVKTPQKREKLEEAKLELYKAQSNCAYWHGIFGGIYTKHLRRGVYSHIMKAEAALAPADKEDDLSVSSYKFDAKDIVCVKNRFLSLFINPNYAGSVFEIGYIPLSYNITNTISRRYEPYHEKIKKTQKPDIGALKERIDKDESVDLYEVLGVKERNLKRFLHYDPYCKFSLLCHAMDTKTSFSDFINSTHAPLDKNSFLGPYEHEIKRVPGKVTVNLQRDAGFLRLHKCIIMEREREIFIKFHLENISPGPAKLMFGVEFNWSVEDRRFMRRKEKRRLSKIALRDKSSGLTIDHIFEKPVNLWAFPIYTLNETEGGLGKSFQEISLLFHRKLLLESGGKFSLGAKIRISG